MHSPIEDGWNTLLKSGAVDMFDATEKKTLRWMFFAGASFMFSHIVEVSTHASDELDRFGAELHKAGQGKQRKQKQ